MDWEFGSALERQHRVMGEILDAAQGRREFTWRSAIRRRTSHGAAEDGGIAGDARLSSIASGSSSSGSRAANPEWLAAKQGDGGKLMRSSHNVLLAHEDKTFSGAFVASASIPWGQAKGDDDLGGYHLVWTRDMVQTATALLACGRVETALRALVYLACTQQPDGGFAQNFWIDGTPYWTGIQLDEVAFPLILAWRLVEGRRAGRVGRLSVCGAGGGVPGAPCADHAAGALGGECGLFAVDAGGGDCGADLRGRDCARARFSRSWRVFLRSLPTGSRPPGRLDGDQRRRAACRR
jgi:hypothetical protein